jgi:uncharacterized metal-binding protein
MSCGCSSGSDEPQTLIYACSGAANTGYLADQVARKLNRDGKGDMTCLAAVGADLSGFLASARGTDVNLVIDGCAVACGQKLFQKRDLPITHVVMTNFGVIKGETVITPNLVDSVSQKVWQAVQ